MRAHIAVHSPIAARAAGNRIYNEVHDSVHIALGIEVDNVGTDLKGPFSVFSFRLPQSLSPMDLI